MKRTRRFEFDEVVWRIVESWKFIIVMAVIGAILGAGVSYKRSADAINEQIVAADNNISLVETMTEEEILSAYEYAADLKSKRACSEYVRDSILMSLDPNRVYMKKIQYYVENLPKGTEDTEKSYETSYSTYLCNKIQEEEAFATVATEIGENVTPVQVKELVQTTAQDGIQKEKNYVDIIIYAPNQEIADKIQNVISRNIEQAKRELADKGIECEVRECCSEIGFCYSAELQDIQNNKLIILDSLRTQIENLQLTLPANSIAYGEQLFNGIEISEGNLEKTDIPKAKLSVKFTVLLTVFFVILALMFVVVAYIFTTNVESKLGYEELGLNVLGDFRLRSGRKIDIAKKIKYSIQKGKMPDDLLGVSYCIANISESKKVCVIGNESEWAKTFYEDFKNTLKENNVAADFVNSKLNSIDSMKAATKAKEVLYLAKDGQEKWEDIINLTQICEKLDVKLLGVLLV